MNRSLKMVSLLVISAVSVFAIWPFSSAREFRMTSGSGVPAATGSVETQKDKKNGNTRVRVKVFHLASASSLTPAANVYIVWIRPRGEAAIRQGAIAVDNDLKGELKVVTVSKDFDIFVTAEQSENVTAPSGVEVLRTHVSTR